MTKATDWLNEKHADIAKAVKTEQENLKNLKEELLYYELRLEYFEMILSGVEALQEDYNKDESTSEQGMPEMQE